MARKRKKKNSSLKVLLLVLVINISLYILFNQLNIEKYIGTKNVSSQQDALVDIYNAENYAGLTIHFVNVGQGDAILITESGKSMLIDAGPTNARDVLIKYLQLQGVNELEYVIATHAHEDHIGGMASIIQKFKINNFLISKYTSTSKTYENLVVSAKDKKLEFYAPKSGEEFSLGRANFKVISDGSFDDEEMNNHSIVIRVEYGENSFLFMGDAQEALELDIISSNYDIESDVIKIGHHGSNTSTSNTFLKAVNPDYAVISVGANNSYGHPCKSVMQRLKIGNIDVYRTDENSNIILKSDGKNITFNVQPGTYSYISAN